MITITESAAPPRPVVFVLADDLGYSDLGCYGAEIRTPHLDRLGRDGVRLTQFYNTARCSTSRGSLLTRPHPHQTGVGILTDALNVWEWRDDIFDPLAYQGSGQRTAATATPLGPSPGSCAAARTSVTTPTATATATRLDPATRPTLRWATPDSAR